MEHLIIPKDYHSELNLHDTQIAIKTVKDFFQNLLALRLNLSRVSAPLFVDPLSGLNDNLNGIERPVTFDIKEQNGKEAEVVQSLAKWKRYALKKYGFDYGEGLYTDMNAIRRDEDTDNIHSIFVDQWDWEKIIHKEDRNIETLKETVPTVYNCLRKTEKYMAIKYDYIEEILPHDIFFITTQELEEMFPDNTPKEREYYITKTKGAVCIMTSHLRFLPWVSGLTRKRFSPSSKKQAVRSVQNFLSRKRSSTKSFLIQSVVESDSPVSVCSSFARHILERYSLPCGRKLSQKNVKRTVFSFCNRNGHMLRRYPVINTDA